MAKKKKKEITIGPTSAQTITFSILLSLLPLRRSKVFRKKDRRNMRSASYIWLTGWHLVHKSPQPVHGGNVLWKETHFRHCSLPPSWALALSGNLCILSSQRSDDTWNINGFPKSRQVGVYPWKGPVSWEMGRGQGVEISRASFWLVPER